ncbi:hypothetical protein [Streptomyces sp. NPDC090022]|uniref:hypothetical protein n=1 Tax=Streptomyces sp. NPDC090022 TaxID=3365920 RepID=UPI00380BFDA4
MDLDTGVVVGLVALFVVWVVVDVLTHRGVRRRGDGAGADGRGTGCADGCGGCGDA